MTIKISSHSDADGLSSTVLLLRGLGLKRNQVEIEFPKEFGGGTDYDYMLDMCPLDPQHKAIVFDHHEHPGHPKKKNRKYKLYFEDIPTGGIVYKQFKKQIPEEEHFKAAIAYVGDMQEEDIPLEIFKTCPELLNEEIYIRNGYDDAKPFMLMKYKRLSSPINATARMGEKEKALEILYHAKKPDDILLNPVLKKWVNKQKQETYKVYEKWKDEELPKPKLIKNIFCVGVIDSQYPVNGMIASALQDKLDKTTIIININTGGMSLRGTFCNIVSKELNNKLGMDIGGHSQAMGGTLPEGKTPDDIIKTLNNLI